MDAMTVESMQCCGMMIWDCSETGTGTPPDSIVENVHLNYPLFVIHPYAHLNAAFNTTTGTLIFKRYTFISNYNTTDYLDTSPFV